MTEKELKKLNRYQLLEMIILQTEQVNELTAELEKTRAPLESQQIRAAQAGSIAAAALPSAHRPLPAPASESSCWQVLPLSYHRCWVFCSAKVSAMRP